MPGSCPYCVRPWDEGASVCRGCGAELVKGATDSERLRAGKLGAAAGVFLYVVALTRLGGIVPLGLWWFVGFLAAGFVGGATLVAHLSSAKVRCYRAGGRY